MTVVVGWAPVLEQWSVATLSIVERLVPERQFTDIMRFRRWQDRQARFLARLILQEILRRQRRSLTLADICIDPNGRPFLPGCGDFNISHSATLALCAYAPAGRVGVDVECSQPRATIDDLLPWMSDPERCRIAASPEPFSEALSIWTAKEAVCKAHGCGIASGDLPDCATADVVFRGDTWHVRTTRRARHVVSLARSARDRCEYETFRLKFAA